RRTADPRPDPDARRPRPDRLGAPAADRRCAAGGAGCGGGHGGGGRVGPGGGHDGDAVDVALRALARRDHSAAELDARLARGGVSEDARRGAVGHLVELGYVDDIGYSVRRAELLTKRGLGDEAIRVDLERRGLDREQIEAALSALPAEAER